MSMALPSTGTAAPWLDPGVRRAVTARSLPLGLAIFAAHIAFYGATLWGAIGNFPLWVNILSSVLNGLSIGLLFVLGHDTSHGAFVPGRRLNQILTRIAFIPSLHSASLWDVYHNRVHHAYPNLKGYDCVWVPMSKADYDAAPLWRRIAERLHRGPLGPLTYYLFALWLPKLAFPLARDCRADWRRHAADSVFVVVSGALLIAGIGLLGTRLAPERALWLTLLLGFGLPFLVWNYVMGFSVYLHHTHTDIPWFDDKDAWTAYNGLLRCTTHVDFALNVFPVWSNLMQHTAHHVLPAIPIYHLPNAQNRLLERHSDDVVRYKVSLNRYLALLKACKLYDYEHYCWTDFRGRPTSEPVNVAAAAP